MRRVLRIGHRGAAGHAPENTLAAIQKGSPSESILWRLTYAARQTARLWSSMMRQWIERPMARDGSIACLSGTSRRQRREWRTHSNA